MELEKERQKLQLRKLQADAGLISKRDMVLTLERMDWMYDCPLQAQKEREQEDYLLGKPVDQNRNNNLAATENVPCSLYLSSVTKTTEDTLRKLREDPLLLIRQAEHKQRRAIMSNPLLREKLLLQQQQAENDREHHTNNNRVEELCGREKPCSNPHEKIKIADEELRRRRYNQHERGVKRHQATAKMLSKDEIERRLRQMQDDGRRHEERKDDKLSQIDRKEKLQQKIEDEWRHKKKGFSLMQKLNKEAYVKSDVELLRKSRRRRVNDEEFDERRD